jgi:hypothetical protein
LPPPGRAVKFPHATSSRAPSNTNSRRFSSKPPPKPVNDPFAPITRWQGTITEMGFAPFASPTALTLLGFPIRAAISP